MTEIAWLVQFMLDHKLPIKAKDAIIARIGEVESRMSKPQIMQYPGNLLSSTAQAPSTQRLLEQQVVVAPTPTRIPVQTEIVTSTGNGTMTKGPKKW